MPICPASPFRRPEGTLALWPLWRVCAALLLIGAAGHAAAADVAPDALFVQYGRSISDTRALTIGAVWDWQRHWALAGGTLGGYWDLALGHWSARGLDGRDESAVTQLGVTPTFRWRPAQGASPWFVEGAVGFTVLAPLYRSRGRRFSTTFNFADHLAVGRNFGEDRQHELALRLEHYSNGGMRHPNPGENFWQVRYTRRWGP